MKQERTSTGFDIYQAVTERIIAQLEKGVVPWHKPWKMVGVKIKGDIDARKVAFNRISKMAYSPLNQMLLSRSGEYATFNQWKGLGGHIKKGAKAEMVVFWKKQQYKVLTDKEEGNEDSEETGFQIRTVPVLKFYQVFHIEDVDGVKPLDFSKEEIKSDFDESTDAESVIANYTARENLEIRYGGDSAFYAPLQDYICLPERFQFGENTAEFYSTAFHEMVHSTGHQTRLDRLSEQKNACFGSKDYSKEELVAEIGASGLCNLLSIETESSFTNSVAYIQSWLQALKNDKKMIVSASSKAEKAVCYILNGKESEVQA